MRHGVDFVVVRGVAANAHGLPEATFDLDVVPAEPVENLERLSSALRELNAGIRADATGRLKFNHDGSSLGRALIWNLRTDFGDLDVIFRPGGIEGYEELPQVQ